jgi:dTDP-4-dehydrorhamnose 3,5-epimerase
MTGAGTTVTVSGLEGAVRDSQTVTPAGASVQEPIAGVQIRSAVTQADERGTLTEVFDERWGFTDEPVPFAYAVTAPPGGTRAWVVHLEQDDRLFFFKGTAKVALYDAREGSTTRGATNVHYFGAHRRVLLRIPAGVVHAVKNVGADELVFMNLPTRPYAHEDPDKYRYPADAVPIRL